MKEVKTKSTIGLWSAIAIGIGGMIGAGIFSILGLGITIGGNLVYVSFIAGGIIALLSAYSYSKLSICYPSAGGAVEFLIRGFEDNIFSGGFNFLLWSGYIFALSLYSKAFGVYASTFLPAGVASISAPIIAILIMLVFTMINFLGPEVVGRSETFIVGVKVSILIIFACLGLLFVKGSLLSASNFPSAFGVLTATAIVFLGYEGFGLIANTAEDIKNPRKNIPKALYMSIIFAMLIYVAVSLAVVGNLPLPEIIKSSDYALAAAAKPFAGSIGFTIIAIAALFSTASAINATLYGGVNVSYLMAKQGELPSFFTIKKWREAKEGLFITAGIVIILTLFLDLNSVAMMGSALFLIIYAGVNFAHLKLYKKTDANKYIIWLAIAGCLFSFIILVYYEILNSPKTLAILFLVVLLSFLVEWLYRKYSRRTLKKRKVTN